MSVLKLSVNLPSPKLLRIIEDIFNYVWLSSVNIYITARISSEFYKKFGIFNTVT